jgi:hypothetical protein
MRLSVITFLAVSCIIFLVLASGCAGDITAKQKVGAFGTAFGASSEEQKAIDWFKATYGDPQNNPEVGPRFVLPIITSGISDKNLPVDNVTTFPVSGGSVYFFVIYDNFKKDDPITVSWVYLVNGKEVASVQQQAGGDFGRFIVEFQKPDAPGWGTGRQRITVTGDGATASVEFVIGDTLQITPLPYNPAGGQGPAGIPGSTVAAPGFAKTTTELPSRGVSGMVTTTTVASTDLNSDPKNCGSTGTICPTVFAATSTCSSGKCGFTCKANNADCNKNPSDGCEVNLGFAYNCGACGNVCEFPHGWGDCSNSQCVLQRCDDGWYSSNENDADGCEVDIWSNDNCGSYGHKCGAGKYCVKGSCQIDCPRPNTISQDGLRCVDTQSDTLNCGVLYNVCRDYPNAKGYCENGQCKYRCSLPDILADCDKIASNGCENDLKNNENCGACGHKCNTAYERCFLPDGETHVACFDYMVWH